MHGEARLPQEALPVCTRIVCWSLSFDVLRVLFLVRPGPHAACVGQQAAVKYVSTQLVLDVFFLFATVRGFPDRPQCERVKTVIRQQEQAAVSIPVARHSDRKVGMISRFDTECIHLRFFFCR